MYRKEYEWARLHPDDPDGKNLLTLAQLYAAHQDLPTLGLIEGVVDNIRIKMNKEPRP